MTTKVVHLITLLELGGAQGNTLYTVRHLDPTRFDAHLWCGKGAYWDESAKKDLGAAQRLRFFPRLVRPIHPLYDLLVVFDLWAALRTERPAILHTHSSKAGIVGRLAARLAGVPTVIHTFHGFGFNDEQKPWTKWFFIFLEKTLAPLTTTLVFVSQANRDQAAQLGIGSPEKYQLIRSGIPLASIRKQTQSADTARVRASLGIPAEAPLVTTIGPFKPQKNLGAFLSAAALIRKEVPHAHFLMIGDGALRPALERQAQSEQLGNYIHMPGWREDAAQLLASSTVFTMTSLWEGLPRSLVEALAIGIPSVCFATDGVRDLLHKGGGTAVAQHDIKALAQACIKLLKDRSFWAQTAEKARATVTPDFDIDIMVNQQESLYQTHLSALDKHRRIN